MRFEHVAIAAVAHVLPDERVTSEALEARLAPLYDRLRLRTGRLELMSGIRERRFWPPGTRPSDAAARAGELALARGLSGHGIERSSVGCLIHGAVSRDFLEPATASVVHARLGLDPRCHVFDLSNACLGVLNGMVVIAEMIERGALEAGLVVSGEDGRGLVEETLATLLASRADDRELRAELKLAFASLTIGSGACAVLLARAEPGREIPRLLSATAEADTRHVELCQGDRDLQGSGPTMSTDSEALLQAGVALAPRTFTRVLDELGWTRADVERVVTHQVGGAHRRLLLERLELDPARDFPTFETLGNTGSAALPTALSLALAAGHVRRGERAALLGIGSGLHCLMLGTRW
jgi:3-oxoacyl-[acyl-carrier-protein] synthase-3